MLEKFLKNGKRNMEYRVKLTDQFLDEFEEICDYISNKLKNIDASNRLRDQVKEEDKNFFLFLIVPFILKI